MLCVSPIAVGGNRYAGWLTRLYPGDWSVLSLKKKQSQDEREYELLLSSPAEPDPKKIWNAVKSDVASKSGVWF